MLIQDLAYQTYVNGVATTLHQNKKGIWPLFPLITKFFKIENFKQARDEVGVLTFYKFKVLDWEGGVNQYVSSL